MSKILHLQRVAYFSRYAVAGIVYHAIVDENACLTACGFHMGGEKCETRERDEIDLIIDVLCGVCEDDLATTVPARVVFVEPQWSPYGG